MNSKKHILNKEGSYIVEASISLPVFILCVLSLALIINIISICEGISFVTAKEMHNLDLLSYKIKIENPLEKTILTNEILDENDKLKDIKVTKFKYLYSNAGIDNLIALEVEANFDVLNPIGVNGHITFNEALLSRGFTGKDNESNKLTVEDFESDTKSSIVTIFPRYGERYHKSNCTYVTRYGTYEYKQEIEKEDAKRKGYTPCKVCFKGIDE